MKRIALIVIVGVLVFGLDILAQQKTGSVEQELLKLEQGWADAIVKADVALLDRMLGDDFTYIDGEGILWTKTTYLSVFKSGEAEFSSMVSDEMKVRVYGDAAVVTGRNTIKGTFRGDEHPSQERFTDTWINRDGRWQCVATHSSKVAGK